MKKMNVRMLTQISMLIALQLVLSRFLSISTDSLRIGFGFVPMALCGIMFGPYWGAIAYALADIIGAMLFYGSLNPLITISVMIAGFCYGLFLHRENVRFFPNVALAVFASCIICSGLITTFALSLYLGNPFIVQLTIRLPQILTAAVAEGAVIPILLQLNKSLVKHGLAATY
ncbi:MAG: folate family ECF transporter S component [Oscillospiraceae bacterium]